MGTLRCVRVWGLLILVSCHRVRIEARASGDGKERGGVASRDGSLERSERRYGMQPAARISDQGKWFWLSVFPCLLRGFLFSPVSQPGAWVESPSPSSPATRDAARRRERFVIAATGVLFRFKAFYRVACPATQQRRTQRWKPSVTGMAVSAAPLEGSGRND